MTAQTVTIQVEPQVAVILHTLRKKADALGLTLEVLLRPLAEGSTVDLQERPLYETATPDELADAFLNWVKTHSVKGTIADDSRESIYTSS
jgi:hypothetical protein